MTKVEVALGEFVHEQATLLNIAQIDPLFVEAYLPVAVYGQVRPGMAAAVELEQPVGGRYRATVAVVDQVFDAASGTFGLRLVLANKDHALPAGLKCQVTFLPDAQGPAAGTEQPVSAVATSGSESSAESTSEAHPTGKVLVRQVQLSLIKAGLDPGDADGHMGPKTVSAIRTFQSKAGLADDKGPEDEEVLRRLLIELEKTQGAD